MAIEMMACDQVSRLAEASARLAAPFRWRQKRRESPRPASCCRMSSDRFAQWRFTAACLGLMRVVTPRPRDVWYWRARRANLDAQKVAAGFALGWFTRMREAGLRRMQLQSDVLPPGLH
jgi:hypothetical protein